MCSAPTHTALLTSLLTFIESFFSSTLPVTKTNMLIVFLHWQKCYCEKIYLESNWVGRNNDWLLDHEFGWGGGRGGEERNHWISPLSTLASCFAPCPTGLFVSPPLAMSGLIVQDSLLHFHLLRLRYGCLAFVTCIVHYCYDLDKRK